MDIHKIYSWIFVEIDQDLQVICARLSGPRSLLSLKRFCIYFVKKQAQNLCTGVLCKFMHTQDLLIAFSIFSQFCGTANKKIFEYLLKYLKMFCKHAYNHFVKGPFKYHAIGHRGGYVKICFCTYDARGGGGEWEYT